MPLSSENNDKPEYCPYCGYDAIDYIGQTPDGFHIIHCRECAADFAVKDVTGKIEIKLKISG
jgi:transposase-like protein